VISIEGVECACTDPQPLQQHKMASQISEADGSEARRLDLKLDRTATEWPFRNIVSIRFAPAAADWPVP
jgi:hypothetical protein